MQLVRTVQDRHFNTDLGVLSIHVAAVFLGLLSFAYVIRGGTLLFGFLNLTPVFLMGTVLCVGVHLVSTKQLRFQLTWADLALVGLGLVLLANSHSAPGIEKSIRFLVLVLVPYFLARVILVELYSVKLFLYTILAAVTVIGLMALAYSVLPAPLSSSLPFQLVDWGRRLVFLQVNPVPMAMFYMVGFMLYVGLASSWRFQYKVFGIFMIGVFLYDILTVGTRGSVAATFVTLCVGLVVALTRRELAKSWVLIAAWSAVAYVGYTILAGALAPANSETAVATTEETQTSPDQVSPLSIPTSSPTRSNISVPSVFFAPTVVQLPNQERFETMASPIVGDPKTEKTIVERFDRYATAVSNFRQNPVTGLGTASMDPYAHNIILETMAELGLIGLALLLPVFASVARSLLHFVLVGDDRKRHAGVVVAVFLVTCALFAQKQLSNDLTHHKDLVAFVAIILNFPMILGLSYDVKRSSLRRRVPPRLRFLVPAVDSTSLTPQR